VVLDEAQLLPPEFLSPILHALKELQKNYGVTLLLSTATQPALKPYKSFDHNFEGLTDMVEIVESPMELHNQLKRVELVVPQDLNKVTSWDDLSTELMEYESVLCVVNRRDDCRILWSKMPKGTFHLSALMCGAHRSARITTIKERLKQGLPTRVISTQLVEAGVDLDFPVVYRAVAGLDSIAQAAGRCNREGLLHTKGKVIVFIPPSETPPGYLRQAAEIGKRLISQERYDILAPDRFEAFFKEFYWLQGEKLDKHQIMADLKMSGDFRCSFRTAAEKFRIIDERGYAPVVVAYEEGSDLIRELEKGKPDRLLLRRLQRYTINIPRYLHSKFIADSSLRELPLSPGIYVQSQPSLYDEDIGFCPDRSLIYEPDELIL
jgi:CRISPR-associated endonuclease/helicase Cas3